MEATLINNEKNNEHRTRSGQYEMLNWLPKKEEPSEVMPKREQQQWGQRLQYGSKVTTASKLVLRRGSGASSQGLPLRLALAW